MADRLNLLTVLPSRCHGRQVELAKLSSIQWWTTENCCYFVVAPINIDYRLPYPIQFIPQLIYMNFGDISPRAKNFTLPVTKVNSLMDNLKKNVQVYAMAAFQSRSVRTAKDISNTQTTFLEENARPNHFCPLQSKTKLWNIVAVITKNVFFKLHANVA